MSASGDSRVLVLTPTAKDFDLLQSIFARHGIQGFCCNSLETACAELTENGGGVLILSEEVLSRSEVLTRWLESQPPWSDLPILVLARPGADSTDIDSAVRLLGNVTILERPMRVATMISAVQSALRARNRQYQIRLLLADNERSEAELRANDKRKDEFLAILAHELRNPMAPISNGLQILKFAVPENSEVAALGKMMQRQIDTMKRLVDDLLEVSRVTRGKLELRMETAELSTIVDDAVEASQSLIAGSNHRLQISLPPQPVYLRCDPVRLAQVISNLLNNAAKYTPQHGKIALSAEVADAEIRIQITDNGVGIAREMQSHVFDMFMQVDRDRHSSHGGLGIGLTLVKSLVELHNGNVEVFSAGPGLGSRFTIRLPRVETVSTERMMPHKTDSDLSHLNILIADDNKDAADSLGSLLQCFHASVQIVYCGEDALNKVERGHTHAAILDIGMDDIDGLEVARRIRAREKGDDIVLIALTGLGQQHNILESRSAGFDHHFTKPVDINQLLKIFAH